MNLDDELRRLFDDDRLDVAVRPDADRVIVAGAKRIRRRRFVAATAGVVAAAVLLGSGVALAGDGMPSSLPPARPPTTHPTTTEPPPTTTMRTTTTPPPPASPPGTERVATRTGESTHEQTTTGQPPTTPEPVVVTDAVFGPTGYGPLVLGMSLDAAVATGALGEALWDNGICTRYPINGGGQVLVSHAYGTTAISAGPSARTPEGIAFGSTVADVRAAYPAATDYRYGVTAGAYQFYVEGPEQEVYPDDLAVIDMRIDQAATDCANAW